MGSERTVKLSEEVFFFRRLIDSESVLVDPHRADLLQLCQ